MPTAKTATVKEKMQSAIQTIPNRLGERGREVGLLQKIDAVTQGKILPDHIQTVAAGEDHLEVLPFALYLFRQLAPVHAFRHDHVRQQQLDGIGVLLPDS